MPKLKDRTHTDNCGRTGKGGTLSCKLDCSCWCHKPQDYRLTAKVLVTDPVPLPMMERQSVRLLNLAAIYADDGALNTAVEHASHAIELLKAEIDTRTAWMREVPSGKASRRQS